MYTSDPHIEQSVVKAIRDAVDVPLVLHGTSGVPDEQVAEAVKNGICKVNYATELRQAYTKASWLHGREPCLLRSQEAGQGGYA